MVKVFEKKKSTELKSEINSLTHLLTDCHFQEAILQQLPSGFLMAEAPSGKLVFSNLAAEKILDLKFKSNINISEYSFYYQGFYPDGRKYESKEWPLARSLLKGEVISNEEINILRKDKSTCLIQVSSTPIYDSDKKMIAAVATFEDITTQKYSETLTQQALQKYQSLINTIDGIVWEADENIRFTFVSKQAERLLGYPIEEWYAPHFWANHLYQEDRVSTLAFCQEQTGKLLPHDFEYRFVAQDGKIVWLRDIVSIVMKNNEFAGLRGIMVDVTEKKRAEQKLEESEEQKSTILESALDAIISMGDEGKINMFNLSAEETFGYKSSEVVGREMADLIIPLRYREEYRLKLKKFLDTGGSPFIGKRFELTVMRSSGREFPAEISITRVKKNGTAIFTCFFRDITERKLIESEREKLLAQEQLARLGAEKSVQLRDDFLSIASHELKTPLTPIRIQLQIVRRYIQNVAFNLPKVEPLLKGLEDADRQFDRFLKLLENLLDVSRITADRLTIERHEVNLSKLVGEVAAFFMPELNKRQLKLNLEIQPNVIGFWDKTRLEQIINNLLSNAIKYGGDKPITIKLWLDDTQSAIPKAQLVVQDHGIGIAKEEQVKLFGKFQRIAPVGHYGGLGLGLYIAHSIAVAHGGSINVESSLGNGATFRVELPTVMVMDPVSIPKKLDQQEIRSK